jgi:large subunit ribosomal protein L23
MNPTPSPEPRHGLQLEPYQIILRPLITEKGTHLHMGGRSVPGRRPHNTFTFEVHSLVNKTQIKAAIQELFNVRVEKVRTQTKQGKRRRFKARIGKTASWKKALVTLHEEDRIEFF